MCDQDVRPGSCFQRDSGRLPPIVSRPRRSGTDGSCPGVRGSHKAAKPWPGVRQAGRLLGNRPCLIRMGFRCPLKAGESGLRAVEYINSPFSISALTNITHEHLDYHHTMEKYKDAKKILFHTVSRTCHRHLPEAIAHIPHKQTIILNTTDKYFQEFNEISCTNKITYGIDSGDLRAHHVTCTKFGSKFALHYGPDEIGIELKIPGSFNVENALTATGNALACKVSLDDIKRALESFEGVPGRMETIKSPRGFEVLVDFALTPDALEKLYKTIHETNPKRVIGIIGSCGDRDKEKRPLMGRIVAQNTDVTIVTDEEPYSEDPMVIMKAVLDGPKHVKKLDKDLFLIEDRYKAIEFAVQNAHEGDLIVLTGMGSLPSRTLNNGPVAWDEREVVKEIIQKNC